MSLNTRTAKKFVFFAILLYIGLWAGNMFVDFLPINIGDPTLSSILEFAILAVPLFFLLRLKTAREQLG
jgi:hypothetical protein